MRERWGRWWKSWSDDFIDLIDFIDWMISDLHDQAAGEMPAMHCEILMTTGAMAAVDLTVIGAKGERRVPTVEEFCHIIKRLAKHQFTLTLPE